MSPGFRSRSLLYHFGWFMSFGTCDTNHASNQLLNMFSLTLENFDVLLVTFSSLEGLLSLFLPSRNQFGDIKSRYSRSELVYGNANGRSFIEFEICDAVVSHCIMDSLSL